MSQIQETKTDKKIGFFNIMVLVLSIYVLTALLVDTLIKLPPEVSRILEIVDNAICFFFLLDFSVRFYRAESKLQFMKWGWIDLISSIPTLDIFRSGRTFRLIRLLRILRAFRSTKHLIHLIFQNKKEGTFSTVAIIAVLVVIFSAIAILQVEDDPNSNIKTAEDAIWWAYVTITTVGYGDRYPVTTEGRIIGAFLMTVGVGLFGTFTGFLASWFVEGRKDDVKET